MWWCYVLSPRTKLLSKFGTNSQVILNSSATQPQTGYTTDSLSTSWTLPIASARLWCVTGRAECPQLCLPLSTECRAQHLALKNPVHRLLQTSKETRFHISLQQKYLLLTLKCTFSACCYCGVLMHLEIKPKALARLLIFLCAWQLKPV